MVLAPEASRLAVAVAPGQPEATARLLAQRLGLAFLGPVQPRQCQQAPYLLWQDARGLALVATGRGQPGPVRCEFVQGPLGYRLRHGGGRGQLVAKALGVGRSREPLRVLEATGGLGRDAAVLAGLGCEVTLLERSPVIVALLEDGLARAARAPGMEALVERLEWVEADARTWLARPDCPVFDVIHLDPMFPEPGKRAQVKKEMQFFRALVGEDGDAAELLPLALERARFRVAVKRPRRAPWLGDRKPDQTLAGQSSRYDIYINRAAVCQHSCPENTFTKPRVSRVAPGSDSAPLP